LTSEFEVSVLGSFGFSVGGKPHRDLSHGSQRLLAFLALRDRSVIRTAIAGTLWPEASEKHAYASLRSELSRLDGIARTLIRGTFQELALADRVAVDIRDARRLAHRLLKPGAALEGDLSSEAIALLSEDLLPDWYDDWAVAEAEEWRQLRLHALDALAEQLIAARRYGDATSAALAAVKAEPLRETAHSILIKVYLAEGNRSEALEAFERYRALLFDELGLQPTPALLALVNDL
jgi:DNA-binding SARP family transcriptional activator